MDPRIEPLRARRRRRDEDLYGVPAHVGRTATDSDPRVDGNANRLYVRFDDGRGLVPAWNNGKFIVNWRFPDTAVRVARNRANEQGPEWEIIGGDTQLEDRFHGAAAPNALSPDKVDDLEITLVLGRRLKPLRPRLWIAGTLRINAETAPYTDADGSEQRYVPTGDSGYDGNTLNLLSNVPAASGGVNQRCWVRPALNRATGLLEAFAGTPALVTLPLDEDGWLDLGNGDGYIPLDPVWLMTGDADETTVVESRWRFGRHLWDGSGSTGAASIDEALIDADGEFVMDADGELIAGAA